jgi:hypothetical protein
MPGNSYKFNFFIGMTRGNKKAKRAKEAKTPDLKLILPSFALLPFLFPFPPKPEA